MEALLKHSWALPQRFRFSKAALGPESLPRFHVPSAVFVAGPGTPLWEPRFCKFRVTVLACVGPLGGNTVYTLSVLFYVSFWDTFAWSHLLHARVYFPLKPNCVYDKANANNPLRVLNRCGIPSLIASCWGHPPVMVLAETFGVTGPQRVNRKRPYSFVCIHVDFVTVVITLNSSVSSCLHFGTGSFWACKTEEWYMRGLYKEKFLSE